MRCDRPVAPRLTILAQQGETALLRRDQHVAGPHLGDAVERDAEVLVVVELLPHERLRLGLVRRHEERLRLDAERKGLPLGVERDLDVASGQLARRLGVEVGIHVTGQRAREDDESRPLRQVAQLLEQHLELSRAHRRTPFVDLGVRAAGRIDDRRRRARLAFDMDEVVEDRLVRQLLDDPGAGGTAHEAGRDDRDTEQLQRTCDVDPLATRERHAGARAMALPTLEVRHGQRPVDRRVECDSDDHGLEQVGEMVQRPAGVPP